MPYINIRVNQPLTQKTRQALQKSTTQLMDELMGKRREVTVVQIEESIPEHWSVNAESLDLSAPTAAYVDIKITADTNSAEDKSRMIQQTIFMLREQVGALQEACYVVIDEIPAINWGYNGQTQAARAANRL